jgi:integrase
VRQATEEYRAEEDALRPFLESYEPLRRSGQVLDDVAKAYREHCERTGEKPLSNRDMAAALRERGYVVERGTRGKAMVKLPAIPQRVRVTFGELFTWWMREYGCKLRGDVEGFLRKRLVSHLDRLPLQEVSPAKLEGLLQSQSEELSAKSLNELRGAVHTIFKRATQRGLWHGANPAAGVERRKVARKLFDTLRAEEVPLLLASLSSTWRPLFAARASCSVSRRLTWTWSRGPSPSGGPTITRAPRATMPI